MARRSSGSIAVVTDAVVIGSGPNGLVAANLLADAGWQVVVVEAAATPGGAVRTAEITAPGFRNDLFSAFYPFGAASPVMQRLQLDRWGLRWSHAPAVVAHPTDDGRVAVLHRDRDVTAASLDAYAPGDGAAWLDIVEQFERIREPLIEALFRPFPPVRPAVGVARALGTAELLRFARFGTLPLRRWADERFGGAGAAALLAGNALHTDLGPDSSASAIFGYLLCMLGQWVGFPVPVGGADSLTTALVRRLEDAGGRVICDARAVSVVVRQGRACAVVTADGREISAGKAVVAAVDAPQLYGELVAPEHLPPRLLDDLRRFQWDNGTVKLDWALSGPIPWQREQVGQAGTVHVGGDLDVLTTYSTQLAMGLVPSSPYLVVGQMTTSDLARSPAGTESAWAYTHVPQQVTGDAGEDGITGRWSAAEVEAVARRMEAQIEHLAPGFTSLIIGRHVMGPGQLESEDPILHRGALNGGTASIHQQLFWRPIPGLGRPETPVRGLFLASMSAHPGGGVHGGPGSNAAVVALRDAGLTGPVRRAVIRAAHRRVYAAG
jgi:phytoene dehydrogenase-like protein